MFVSDLLDIHKKNVDNKNIYLIIEKKEKYKIPMSLQYYVADNIFFFEVIWSNKKVYDDNAFVDLIEQEARNDSCWSDDIYYSPMERIGDCELKFAKNFEEVITSDIFDNCYDIVKIDETDKEILIYLK